MQGWIYDQIKEDMLKKYKFKSVKEALLEKPGGPKPV